MRPFFRAGLQGIGLLGLLCVAAVVFLVQMTSQSRARLASETAALQSLAQTEARLMQQLTAVLPASRSAQVPLPEDAIWPQDRLSEAERAIQDAVLPAAQQSGLTVVSFGGLGGDARCIMACSTYEIELTGGHAEVIAFLAAVEAIRPALSTRQVWMRQMPSDGLTDKALINLRLVLWALAPQAVTGQSE